MSEQLQQAIDSMLQEAFKPDEPGAAVIITQNGKPIFRKGYGMANIELGVAIEPHMVFRLGSITKQFTAVCILMLCEQGKLSLDDEVTQYLPDYPTHGHKITVEHLLTHTSGIKSYTNMPDFLSSMRKDMSLEELINSFKYQPMEFAPGTRFNYNNSGYILLGAIIEKASGLTYEDFLQKNIFDPLGMKNSYFDNPNRIQPGRAQGYKPAAKGYENADYISMTLPHAAGSLACCVDNMAAWDEAFYTEKLVKQTSLQKAWTPYTLKDGTSTGYGYGWAVSTVQDHYMIIHGGGIPGFVTEGFRFPYDHIYVCILTNRQKEIPNDLPFRLGALVAGRPFQEPVAIPFDPRRYAQYTGVYKEDMLGFELPVTQEGEQLVMQMPGGEKSVLLPLSDSIFAVQGTIQKLEFDLGQDGNARACTLRGFYGPGMHAVKTDKPLPGERKSIALKPDQLAQYAGDYEVMPGVKISCVLENDHLMVYVPGQNTAELHAEAEHIFFLKEAPVTITFQKDASGKVNSALFNQAGREMPAKKIK